MLSMVGMRLQRVIFSVWIIWRTAAASKVGMSMCFLPTQMMAKVAEA
jgi:hypothetical protein